MTVKPLVDLGFLKGSTKSRSFVDALSSFSSDVVFLNLKPSTFHGLPSLWILDEEVLALVAPLHFALVGFFPSRCPSLDAIRKFFFSLKFNGDFSVTLLDHSHVLIKLVNDLNYSRVFSHKSYFVSNCYINIPQLTTTFFLPRILHRLGSLFSRPLKVDHETSICSRPSVARVLVELDITKKYFDKVWIGLEKFGYI
ncbi:hypothetical protein IEQ34_013946 [Dendrobium chrysotoxum]|uniref:DUF4283 domain-containing protein n=1 Tax=Dendrobium chrysotoxum TaxID=161865 RepID=A0AAV7GJY6_DENCH|nr:hypothetical protein IEQ34_013946 [Dendrobium chrysotoxum]